MRAKKELGVLPETVSEKWLGPVYIYIFIIFVIYRMI